MASGSGATISGALRGSLVWLAAIGFWRQAVICLTAGCSSAAPSISSRQGVSLALHNEWFPTLQWRSRPALEDNCPFYALSASGSAAPLCRKRTDLSSNKKARSAP